MKDTPSKISIVVPFRNIYSEDHSVDTSFSVFLNSLKLVSNCVEEVILVNDHSAEGAVDLIEEFKQTNWKILELDGDAVGKKAALKLGIEEARSEYIWTLDVDVQIVNFSKEKLNSFLLELKEDLVILPVFIQSENSLLDFLQSNEWRYMQLLTRFSARIKMPMMCNGANLIFKRSVFLQHINSHESVSSGDDLFLMSQILKSKGEIGMDWNGFSEVIITPVNTFKEALTQRIRWAGKTTKLPFTKSTFLHFLFALFSLLHIIALVGIFIPSMQKISIVFLLLKMSLEVLGVRNIFPNRMNLQERILFVPQMIVYPFFSLFIFITSLFFVPKWKGRRVSLK